MTTRDTFHSKLLDVCSTPKNTSLCFMVLIGYAIFNISEEVSEVPVLIYNKELQIGIGSEGGWGFICGLLNLFADA